MLKTVQKLVLVLLCINICNTTIYSSCCIKLFSKCFTRNKSGPINNESQYITYTYENTEVNDKTQYKTHYVKEVSDISIPNYSFPQNTDIDYVGILLLANNKNGKCLLQDNSQDTEASVIK